jgi:hypothetical protein
VAIDKKKPATFCGSVQNLFENIYLKGVVINNMTMAETPAQRLHIHVPLAIFINSDD